MDNVYQTMQERPDTNKFVIGDFLFAELTCAESDKSIEHWSPVDHIVFVTSVRKSWHSSTGTVTATEGQAVFLKKGARVVSSFSMRIFALCFSLLPMILFAR